VRENRTHGSEGGEAKAFPTPIAVGLSVGLAGRIRTFAHCLRAFVQQNRVDGRDKPGHDGVDGPTLTASNAKMWSLAHHQRGDRP